MSKKLQRRYLFKALTAGFFGLLAVKSIAEEKSKSLSSPLQQLASDLKARFNISKGAALIGFRSRTVSERLSDVVNVRDFILPSDSDSAKGIQRAIDYAESHGALEVYLPAGEYFISRALLVGDKIKIRGSGWRNTVVKPMVSYRSQAVFISKNWFSNTKGSNNSLVITDLKIDGSALTGGTCHGIINMHWHSTFENLSIESVTGRGIMTTAINRAGKNIAAGSILAPMIRRVRIWDTGAACIYALHSTDGWIVDCITGSNKTEDQIFLEKGCAGYHIRGNHLNPGAGSGIRTEFGASISIVGNFLDVKPEANSESKVAAAIYATSILNGGCYLVTSNNIRIRGSRLETSKCYGVILGAGRVASPHAVVSDNTIDCGSYAASVIYVLSKNITGVVSSNDAFNYTSDWFSGEKFIGVVAANTGLGSELDSSLSVRGRVSAKSLEVDALGGGVVLRSPSGEFVKVLSIDDSGELEIRNLND